MKPMYNKKQFETAKSTDKLPIQCYTCDETFHVQKKTLKDKRSLNKYCSQKCHQSSRKKAINVNCPFCNKEFECKQAEIRRNKYNFCSRTCNVSYYNKNKVLGTNRSKLEVYIESELSLKFPNIKINYNDREILNGVELDIYIPTLDLAFELNGIFHYEPIFGKTKFDKVKDKDLQKFKLCHDMNISLCIIDTSQQKYFKISTSQKYLEIIIEIISGEHRNRT